MNIPKSYPRFEDDQVLTAEQLNDLFKFLDLQNRWTRKCFVGSGIACGLNLSVDPAGTYVDVSEGAALTTMGYLFKLDDAHCTHYREYTDPIQYEYFEKFTGTWYELLTANTFDSEDPDHLPIDQSFLDNKIALLYLECQDVNLDSCTGNDCDEKGQEIQLNTRILLVDKVELAKLVLLNGNNGLKDYYKYFKSIFQVNHLNIGRIKWLGCEDNLKDDDDVNQAYAQILDLSYQNYIRLNFTNLYNVLSPLIKEDYPLNPLISWKLPSVNSVAYQYYYDFVKDLVEAFNELVDYTKDIFYACCVESGFYDKHIFLGELYPVDTCQLSDYRHYFVRSMEPTNGEMQVKKVVALYKRLVLLTKAFRVPDFSSSAIRVTPDRGLELKLSERTIPYYYDLDNYSDLARYWSFHPNNPCKINHLYGYYWNQNVPECGTLASDNDHTRFLYNKKSIAAFGNRFSNELAVEVSLDKPALLAEPIEDIFDRGRDIFPIGGINKLDFYSYSHINPHIEPLTGYQDKAKFYRFEGHLGKGLTKAYDDVSKWVKCFNIPVKVIYLRAGSSYTNLSVTSECYFRDLDLIYQAQRLKIICFLNKALGILEKIQIDDSIDNYDDSEVSQITGRFISRDGAPITNVYYTIEELEIKTRNSSETGAFSISDLEPGKYTLIAAAKGYRSKTIPFSMRENASLDFGDITLVLNSNSATAVGAGDIRYDNAFGKGAKKADGGDVIDRVSKADVSDDYLYRVDDSYDKYAATAGEVADLYIASEKALRYDYNDLVYNIGTSREETPLKVNIAEGVRLSKSAASVEELSVLANLEEEAKRNSHKELGAIFDIAAKDSTKDIYKVAEEYVYSVFPNVDIFDVDILKERVYTPLEIANVIRSIISLLEEENFLSFKANLYKSSYTDLVNKIITYSAIIEQDEYIELLGEEVVDQLLRQFYFIEHEQCFVQFTGLIEVFAKRKIEVQKLQLMSYYSCKFPGMVHVGGSWAGGTFIMIYDESDTVVLDFALPYIVDSNCPPIQICKETTVVFKLPKDHYCNNDDKSYKFIITPPGGEVVGDGVVKEETTGDYYFKPSTEGLLPGIQNFRYLLNHSSYDYQVELDFPQVEIYFEIIEVDNEAQTAEVRLTTGARAYRSYEWDFGDGDTSTEEAPVKTYDISEQQSFEVRVRVLDGECYATDTYDITFEICNAQFRVNEDVSARTLDTITYVFNHPQLAKTRVWEFSDGETVEGENPVIRTFELGEEEQEITVKLTITQDTCGDESEQTIVLPPATSVNVFMNKTEFCREEDERELVSVSPRGGTLSGNGLIVQDGEYYFDPRAADVTLGTQTLIYTYEDYPPVEIDVTVDAIEEVFGYSVEEIDGDEFTAEVQFTGPSDMDSYSWDLGDGNTSTQPAFTHTYDVSEQTEFNVVLNVQKGACNHDQEDTLTLEPCSAEFTSEVIAENGQTVTVRFTAANDRADFYQWADHIGTVVSATNVIERTYPLSAEETDIEMTLYIEEDVCHDTFSGIVTLPALTPISISLDKYIYTVCDSNVYPITVSPRGGEVTGPGVEFDGENYVFRPAFVTVPGSVSLVYQLPDGQSASAALQVMRPTATISVREIYQEDTGIYIVEFNNNSRDYNQMEYSVSAEFEQLGEETIRLFGVEPGMVVTVVASVSWDGECDSKSREINITIPQGENGGEIEKPPLDIEIQKNLDTIKAYTEDPNIGEIFNEQSELYQGMDSFLQGALQEVREPEVSIDYAKGGRNDDLAEQIGQLLGESSSFVIEATNTMGMIMGEAAFNVWRTNLDILFDFITHLDQDLSRSEPLYGVLIEASVSVDNFVEEGLNLKENTAFANMLQVFIDTNNKKANATSEMKAIYDLLTGV